MVKIIINKFFIKPGVAGCKTSSISSFKVLVIVSIHRGSLVTPSCESFEAIKGVDCDFGCLDWKPGAGGYLGVIHFLIGSLFESAKKQCKPKFGIS